jgi:CRISPR-associated endonuclease/helicase Cas3
MARELLAHSPKPPVPEQTYFRHGENVHRNAITNARSAAAYYRENAALFESTVDAAALYHDLGKLDDANQCILERASNNPLPIVHEDAGTQALLNLGLSESAMVVSAHHRGLFSFRVENSDDKPENRIFRHAFGDGEDAPCGGEKIASQIDRHLQLYIDRHRIAGLGCPAEKEINKGTPSFDGFTRRVALSCLVDADHGDTARHYRREVPTPITEGRWTERLAVLEQYVANLPKGDGNREQQRNILRQKVYEACRNAPIDPAIRSCDAPVGSGKTTAVMAHLLRVAAAHKPPLRHIFVVLPYTNIIKQSVETYRKALVLPGERPEDVVAEHHHQADFETLELRQLATLWRAPIIVTTAVQFFETLASHHPARLRKLHELPGSAAFVDETHAAIPSHLWPQVWRWLETWTRDWGGHIVFASGSLPRFWELPEFVEPPKKPHEVPDLVPDSLREELETAEKSRITACRHNGAMKCDELIEFITAKSGPRLLILNTVQSAAVVADRMRKTGHDVLHLSTALAPAHRDRIVNDVKRRLKTSAQNWTLIATSCVEAGMDFSFRTGFRESCSTSSLIQVGGRVSRGAEHGDAAVWDFRTLDDLLNQHPGFRVSTRVLDQLFNEGWLTQSGNRAPSELAKEAMRREITFTAKREAQKIIDAEHGKEYPSVSELCRVIDTDTRMVIIDPKLALALRGGEKISPIRLLRYSVQIWKKKIEEWDVQPVFPYATGAPELYEWTYPYDPDFLGYMHGILPQVEMRQTGGVIF